MDYYAINNKVYYINLDNLFALVSETPNKEKFINTTITQVYGSVEDESCSKEVVESKNSLNETMNNIRYDMLRHMIECLLTPKYTKEGTTESIYQLNDMPFAQGLCFNTLVEYKILVEVENE